MNVCTRPTDPETIATNALFIQFDSSLDQIYRFFDSNNVHVLSYNIIIIAL